MNKFAFLAYLIAVTFTGGLAWAQGGDMNHNDPGKPFLNPYSPANDYQSLDAPQKTVKPNTKSSIKMSTTPNNIGKTTVTVAPTNNTHASLGKSATMKSQPAGTKIDAIRNSLGLGGYDQSGNFGSTSFLDGYLIRSLLVVNKSTIKKTLYVIGTLLPIPSGSYTMAGF